jgi:hypothetical protein
VPAALSRDAGTVQDGSAFQAGGPDGSVKASSATGRWVAAITAACFAGRSAASTSWSFAGSIANSAAVPAPSGVGYRSATRRPQDAVARACGHLAKALALVGGEHGDEDEPDDVAEPVAALEITAPP